MGLETVPDFSITCTQIGCSICCCASDVFLLKARHFKFRTFSFFRNVYFSSAFESFFRIPVERSARKKKRTIHYTLSCKSARFFACACRSFRRVDFSRPCVLKKESPCTSTRGTHSCSRWTDRKRQGSAPVSKISRKGGGPSVPWRTRLPVVLCTETPITRLGVRLCQGGAFRARRVDVGDLLVFR